MRVEDSEREHVVVLADPAKRQIRERRSREAPQAEDHYREHVVQDERVLEEPVADVARSGGAKPGHLALWIARPYGARDHTGTGEPSLRRYTMRRRQAPFPGRPPG